MDKPSKELDPEAVRALALAVELRVVLGNLRRRLREQAHPGDLSWSQMSVLGRLERDGPTTVTVLEAAGLVVGAPDLSDGRQTLLSLTDSCREMVQANRAMRVDWLFRSIRSNLSSREQETLATGVELLRRLGDARESP